MQFIIFYLRGSTKPVLDFLISKIAEVRKKTAFIEKMMLIKSAFEFTSWILVTAHYKFGKSTNLDMIKHFVEVQVDENGKPFENIKNAKTASCVLKTSWK